MFISIENNRIFKSFLPLVTKYCHNLNEFNVSLKDRSKPELNEEFLQLFGPKLKYISCGEDLDFNLFPNLYSIAEKFVLVSEISPQRALGLNLKKLKELNLDLCLQNENLFPEVLQKFNKIRHLSLCLNPNIEKSVLNAFKESAVLQNLIELKISTENGENVNQFLYFLKQSVEKLPKLKSIEFELVFDNDSQYSKLRQHLSPLKAFPELKRLDLELIFLNPQNVSEFSLKAFEDIPNITHLSIEFNDRQMNAKILTNIDKYLPKLQYLLIKSVIITDEEGVTQMAESLSKLSSLHTIDLWLEERHISALMEAKVREMCRKIRKIDI